MRIPKVENYKNNSKIENMDISSVPDLDHVYVILNDKDKIKFIKTVERIVRSSKEYKEYIKFLRDQIDMTCCTYFPKISNKKKGSGRVSIEIHHEPFTLFDITNIIFTKVLQEEEEINPLLVAEEVLKVHYMGMVGLVPLSSTVHGLVTDGKIFIPLQNVYGDYVKFIKEYGQYISPEIDDMLKCKVEMSKDLASNDTSILETKFVYLNVEGMSLPQPITP